MGKEGMVSISNQMGSVLARGRVKRSMAMAVPALPRIWNWIDPQMWKVGQRRPQAAAGDRCGGGIREPLKPGEMASLDRRIDDDTDTHTLSLSDCGLVLASPCFFLAEGDRIYEGGEG